MDSWSAAQQENKSSNEAPYLSGAANVNNVKYEIF